MAATGGADIGWKRFSEAVDRDLDEALRRRRRRSMRLLAGACVAFACLLAISTLSSFQDRLVSVAAPLITLLFGYFFGRETADSPPEPVSEAALRAYEEAIEAREKVRDLRRKLIERLRTGDVTTLEKVS